MEASPYCSVGHTTSCIQSTWCVASAGPYLVPLPRVKATSRGGIAVLSGRRPQNELPRQCGGTLTALLKRDPPADFVSVARRRPLVLRAVEEEQPGEPGQDEPFYASKLVRVAPVILFTLGFIDAGYSGDWSRIGVVTPEVEAALRQAALVVVPTSAVLIWLVVRKPPESTQ